jgi:hypothetical protein
MALFRILSSLLLASICVLAIAQTPPTRVRGVIERFDDSLLVVKARDGTTVNIKLAENFAVLGVTAATLADVTPGKFIGTAALATSDGKLTAIEVLIFPENMRGVGEGHYPWDLQPESTMTNATVADVLEAPKKRVLVLRYKDGAKEVAVPEGVPIVTFVAADRSALKAGAHAFVTAMRQPDGSLTAARVAVGLNGLVPPM